jgi:hypothetical protein
MNFLKKHWIALIVVFIGAFIIYAIYQVISGAKQTFAAAFSGLNPLTWLGGSSSDATATTVVASGAGGLFTALFPFNPF